MKWSLGIGPCLVKDFAEVAAKEIEDQRLLSRGAFGTEDAEIGVRGAAKLLQRFGPEDTVQVSLEGHNDGFVASVSRVAKPKFEALPASKPAPEPSVL